MRYLLILLLGAITSFAIAQSGTDKSYIPNFVPPSPEASSLGKYGEHPVSYYTGIPQINIPLFEINSGRISVPISLSYHASGIKVEQIASRVGLGWSLNAGGVVTRTVAGLTDEQNSSFPCDGLATCNNYGFFHIPSGTGLDEFTSTSLARDIYDSGPDLHFYNIPGRSGKFYFKNPTDYILTNKENILINSPYDGGPFEIITEDGLIYRFEATEITNIGGTCSNKIINYYSSWFLTEIEDPISGKSIDFIYTTITSIDGPNNYSRTYSGNDCFDWNPVSTCSSSTKTLEAKILSRINYDYGYLEFNTNSREDLQNDYAYNEIKHYNLSGDLIKGYSLSTSFVHESGNTTEYAKRLFLNSISEISSDLNTEERYSFGYKMPALLPPRDSKEQDIWGYFNDNNETSFDPAIYIDYSNFGKTRFSIYSSGLDMIHSGADRTPNTATLDIGTLNKITYPTGGYTEFNYEPHVFYYIGGINSRKGAGIRIADKTVRDADGTFLGKVAYTYIQGRIPGAMPQAAIPNSTGVTTFYQNRSHLGSNSGGYVGYDTVLEYQVDESGNNIGAIQYEYWNEPDTEPTFEPDYDQGCGNLTKYSYFPFFEWHSNEIKRGVLKKTSYWEKGYDQGSSPVKTIENSYDRITHENIRTKKGTATAPLTGGGFKLGAIIKLNSEKMLLTSKVETDTDLNGNLVDKRIAYTYYDEYGQEYPDGIHNLALKTRSEKTSQGHYIKTEYKYPFNFDLTAANGIIGDMMDMHYVAPVIQEITSVNSQVISSKVTNYADFGIGSQKILPEIVYATNLTVPGTLSTVNDPSILGTAFEQRMKFKEYYNEKPTLIKYDDHWVKLSWSTSGKLLSKQVVQSESTYTFLSPTQGWDNIADTDAKIGNSSFVYNASTTFPNLTLVVQGGDYIPYQISFWAKGGSFSLSCEQQGAYISDTAPSTWKYYSFDIGGEGWEGGLYFNGSSTIKVNDVKLFQDKAMITTYYYDKFDRLQSVSDPNGRITYYEYDEFNRLRFVKDSNGDIINQNLYHYRQD